MLAGRDDEVLATDTGMTSLKQLFAAVMMFGAAREPLTWIPSIALRGSVDVLSAGMKATRYGPPAANGTIPTSRTHQRKRYRGLERRIR